MIHDERSWNRKSRLENYHISEFITGHGYLGANLHSFQQNHTQVCYCFNGIVRDCITLINVNLARCQYRRS